MCIYICEFLSACEISVCVCVCFSEKRKRGEGQFKCEGLDERERESMKAHVFYMHA